MSTIKIQFDIDNADFIQAPGPEPALYEIIRVLERAVSIIEQRTTQDPFNSKLLDTNGNTVGTVEVTE